MARSKAENAKRVENEIRPSENITIIAKIFKPVARIFGWIARGSEKQPACRS